MKKIYGYIHSYRGYRGGVAGVRAPGLLEEAWPSRPRCAYEPIELLSCLLGPWAVEYPLLDYNNV